jgi:hypothetical protein
MAKNQLTDADVAELKKAREVTRAAKQMGAGIPSPETHESISPVKVVSYETFIPIEGLPSGGTFYPNTVSGQPLKVEDLLLIQTINDRNWYKVFTEIFSRRLRGIEPHNILVCDEIYFALWLRANSYPGYNFPHDGFYCSNTECGVEVPSSAVEFGFLDMNFTQHKLKEIQAKFGGRNSTIITLKSGLEVTLFMKRRSHLARVESVLHRDYYAYGNTPSDELRQLLNIASIINFGDATDIMDTVARLRQLTVMDFSDLISQIKKYTLSGEPSIGLTCPVCGEVTHFQGYTFQPSIYIPIDG